MGKADLQQRKARRVERLGHFLAWAEARFEDFAPKKAHPELWFVPYSGYQRGEIGRAARLFWLGLEASAVDAVLAAPAESGLAGRLAQRNAGDFVCPIDLFGVAVPIDCGRLQDLTAPEWALALPDSPSAAAFEANVQLAVQQLVRQRLTALEAPLGLLDQDERARVLHALHPSLARLEESLPRVIEALNETLHELRYVVPLRHGDLALDIQRRVPTDRARVLSEAEVGQRRDADRRELQERFDTLLEAAGEFDLKLLGNARLAELLQFEPGKLRRAVRVARQQYEEKMAFAQLLESDPRFVHYHEAYPARTLTRRWTALLGPTNSGKTHRAIEAMTAVTHGIYLSPLRLMALENQERIEAGGIPCSLVTGEEQIIREGATHFCCTVEEFARFRHQHWDVVVIDEVQMLADPQRGWAWVDALVAAYAPEVLMTGPALIEPSLKTLCTLCGDHLQVKRTKRLSPVEVARQPVTLKQLEPGSLLVAFARRTVLDLKAMLESAGKRVAVVYGALSPEVRREQARQFREGEAQIMVATDAVGMGLNLPAHTLCFHTDEKFDGVQNRQLSVQEVKQIGGRAGRFGHHDEGSITALDAKTLQNIRRLFSAPDAPVDLTQFQVRPSFDHLWAISELMNEPSLLRAWLTFNRNINYGEAFISILPDELAAWIELIDDPQIPLRLRWVFACTPIRGGFDSPAATFARQWLQQVARGRHIELPRLALGSDLASLESALHVVETYLHLTRALEQHFPQHEKAEQHRHLLNEAITRELARRRQPARSEGRRSVAKPRQCEGCGKPMAGLRPNFRLCDACWRQQQPPAGNRRARS